MSVVRPALLLGANGQLGSDLVRELRAGTRPLVALTRSDVDVRDFQRITEVVARYRPEVIINATAFHKVEACESDPEQAFAVNCLAVRNLAEQANRIDACLVHISTDYVFDGTSKVPYTEESAVRPINAYGTSKAAGEFFLRAGSRRHLLIRTSGLYGLAGSSGKGGNFVQTMLRLGSERGVVSVVNDQTLSPTYTLDLARMIASLVERGEQGVFHVTNSSSCSWYEFAKCIFGLSGLAVEVKPVTTESMVGMVQRPRYSVLANTRLEQSGAGLLRSWRDALSSYLDAAGHRITAAAGGGSSGVRNAIK